MQRPQTTHKKWRQPHGSQACAWGKAWCIFLSQRGQHSGPGRLLQGSLWMAGSPRPSTQHLSGVKLTPHHLRRMLFLLDSQACPWNSLSQFWDWAQQVSAILFLRTYLETWDPKETEPARRSVSSAVGPLGHQESQQPLQFVGAVCWLVHPMSFLKQLKKFLHGNPWVGRAP